MKLRLDFLELTKDQSGQVDLRIEPICALVMNNSEAHQLLATLIDEGRGAYWHKIIFDSVFLENTEQMTLDTLLN